MLAKCANPECECRFLYLRSGKLFRIEFPAEPRENPPSDPDAIPRKAPARVEHYWLCARCAERFKLECDRKSGAVVTTRIQSQSPPARRANAA